MGTGKEQSIKIESSTSLTEEEVKAKISEAETFAEEDKIRKEKVEMRNMADQIVYQTRKTIEEAGDKLAEEDSAPTLEKVKELETMIRHDDEKLVELDNLDLACIQSKIKEVEESMHAISAKLYEAAAAEMASQQEESDDEGVVDADFEVVEDEESED